MVSSHAAQTGERVNTGNKPGSRSPLPMIPMTAADTEVAYLHSWAGWAGVDLIGLGRLYRVNGFVCGLINDDLTPVRELTRRVTAAMDSPTWVEPEGMRENLCGLRAIHMKRWPEVSDTVWQVVLREAA
jgi:hypothetical protein